MKEISLIIMLQTFRITCPTLLRKMIIIQAKQYTVRIKYVTISYYVIETQNDMRVQMNRTTTLHLKNHLQQNRTHVKGSSMHNI